MERWLEIVLQPSIASSATRACYGAALAYWRAWHHLRFASEFPLACTPPRIIDVDTINAFVNDHFYSTHNGRVQLTMPMAIQDVLAQGRRWPPTPATTRFRLNALRVANLYLGNQQYENPEVRAFVAAWPRILARRREICASWEAECVGANDVTNRVPIVVTQAVARMVHACGRDFWSRRDAALVVLLQRLTPQQVIDLTFKDVTPGWIIKSEPRRFVAQIAFPATTTPMQRSAGPMQFLGADYDILLAWASEGEDIVDPNRPFLVRPRSLRSRDMRLSLGFIRRRIAKIARRAGLVDPSGKPFISPRWIRLGYLRELRESSLPAILARKARISIESARRLLQTSKEVPTVPPRE